ncbi:uncharacterized protein [Typha latifolia]|uniref:uncharacterized protein n=1 Tax=Typha latifolia TaxID=4733 RepID=UPI003C309E41
MENNKEGKGWMSVPAFGDWDMKNGVPDYSMDFSKIREKKKQSKMELTNRASIGNEDELVNRNGGDPDHVDHRSSGDAADHRRPLHRDHSPTGRKKFMSYFQCCIGA